MISPFVRTSISGHPGPAGRAGVCGARRGPAGRSGPVGAGCRRLVVRDHDHEPRGRRRRRARGVRPTGRYSAGGRSSSTAATDGSAARRCWFRWATCWTAGRTHGRRWIWSAGWKARRRAPEARFMRCSAITKSCAWPAMSATRAAAEYDAFRSSQASDLRERLYAQTLAENTERARATGGTFDAEAFRKTFLADDTARRGRDAGGLFRVGRLRRLAAPARRHGAHQRHVFVHAGPNAAFAALGCDGHEQPDARRTVKTMKLSDPDLRKSLLWNAGRAAVVPGSGRRGERRRPPRMK